jgi:hypothetical protein
VKTTTTLPFGKYRDKDLATVPDAYLSWLLRETKLSSGVCSAVAAELESRGFKVPEPPPPRPVPRCCGVEALVHWHEDRLARRRVRAQCRRCGRSLGFPPCVEPFITLANASASHAPLLDVLTRLEDLGVRLHSDGRAVWFGAGYDRVPPDLRAIVHQCRHRLAVLIGDTRLEVPGDQ